jgi:predicted Zn-ribbon and HTH transcriptional regulator
MKTQTIWASCENCGLAWTQEKSLAKIWVAIPCPKCKHKTDNYDTENHNKGTRFKHY